MKKLKEVDKQASDEVNSDSKPVVAVEIYAKPLRPSIVSSNLDEISSHKNSVAPVASSYDNGYNNRNANAVPVASSCDNGYNNRNGNVGDKRFDQDNENHDVDSQGYAMGEVNRVRDNCNVKSLAEYRRQKDLKFADDSKRVYMVILVYFYCFSLVI